MFTTRRLTHLLLLITWLLAACGRPAATPAATPAASLAITALPTQAPALTQPARPTPPPAPTEAPTPAAAVTPPPPGEYQTLPEVPPPPADLLEVVLARVASGATTLEDGLIAALKLYAGQDGALTLAEDEQPLSGEGTSLLAQAHDYLDHGRNPAARAEIESLLAIIAPSPDQLLHYALPAVQSAPSGLPAVQGMPGRHRPAGRANAEDCRRLWEAGFPPGQQLTCLEFATVDLTGGQGRIFYPAAAWPADPGAEFLHAAAQALVEADRVFAGLGPMRSIDLVFTLLAPEGVKASAPTWDKDASICQVLMYPRAMADGVAAMQQTVAHEVFHCFQLWNIPAHVESSYRTANRWWVEGSAEYFSNVVYPATNDEWEWVDVFDQKSALKALHAMAYENTVFFQYLGSMRGDAAIIQLFQSFAPASSPQASADVLTAQPGMQSLFHDFAQAWADRSIADTGGGYLPTTLYIAGDNQHLINTGLWLALEAPPLSLPRHLLAFAPQSLWQVSTTFGGAPGLESARHWDSLQAWDSLPPEVRPGCESQVVYIYVLTSAAPGADPHKGEMNVVQAPDPDLDPECQPEPRSYGQTACDHPYLPLRPGATWTYSSGFTYLVTSVVGDRDHATATMTLTGQQTTAEFAWDCTADQGLLRYMLRETPAGLPPMELTLVDSAGVVLPRPDLLRVGLEWDSLIQSDSVTSDPGGGTAEGSTLSEDHYVLLGVDAVTFGARTMPGLQIITTGHTTSWFTLFGRQSQPIVSDSSNRLVYAQGIGLIESNTGRLQTYFIP
jgi:hypothetical protein